jgi:hypothetical protein
MATRRNFFKYLGIAGGAAAGGAVTAASLVASSGKSEAVKKIEAAGYNGKLTIGAQYAEENLVFENNNTERLRINSDYVLSIGTTAPNQKLTMVNVSMTPGPDGEMYLKTNGKWRKIVTE